jgi:hypothetical protein
MRHAWFSDKANTKFLLSSFEILRFVRRLTCTSWAAVFGDNDSEENPCYGGCCSRFCGSRYQQ